MIVLVNRIDWRRKLVTAQTCPEKQQNRHIKNRKTEPSTLCSAPSRLRFCFTGFFFFRFKEDTKWSLPCDLSSVMRSETTRIVSTRVLRSFVQVACLKFDEVLVPFSFLV